MKWVLIQKEKIEPDLKRNPDLKSVLNPFFKKKYRQSVCLKARLKTHLVWNHDLIALSFSGLCELFWLPCSSSFF